MIILLPGAVFTAGALTKTFLGTGRILNYGAIGGTIDAENMKVAISNLVDNALYGMPTGGDLYISCDTSVESLVIEVKDTGNGLTEVQIQDMLNKLDWLKRWQHSMAVACVGSSDSGL